MVRLYVLVGLYSCRNPQKDRTVNLHNIHAYLYTVVSFLGDDINGML